MEKLEKNRQKYLKIIKNVGKQGKNHQKCRKIYKNIKKLGKTVKNFENHQKF